LALIPVLAALGFGQADEGPAFLVQPYLQLPTPRGMTILWETDRRLPGRVEYGLTADLGQTAPEEKPAVLHEVALAGLKPGTLYHYRVRSGHLVSPTYSFRTAPPPGTKRWRMAVYGDSRSNPGMHRRVADGIRKAGVDLIVHTGDIVANGKIHESWRKEFFEPLGPLAHSVPWVSTIGNHERDADNYFSYMALPGRAHYFGFDFANAHIVCLDSNAWIEKGRDSEQGRWMREDLARKRDTTWTFVVFHHPLFSAHATRPINPLRWDWTPVLVDPANHVDAVLNGHDHFYARSYPLGRLDENPHPGVLFLTTAGGGAPLYRCQERAYIARAQSAHHFTLFDFDGDRATITAIDVTGKEIDRFQLTRGAAVAGDFCSYEVEEFRRMLGMALARAPGVRLSASGTTTIDTLLRVPTRFPIPVGGKLTWANAPGWKLKQTETTFKLAPGQPLEIPLRAEVAPGAFARNPTLTITFDPGRFRNRTVVVSPFALAGADRVRVSRAAGGPSIDGRLRDEVWKDAESHQLLGLPPGGGRGDRVRFVMDDERFYLGATLEDAERRIEVAEPGGDREGSRLVFLVEHVRLVLSDGKQTHTFAVTPEQVRYHDGGDKDAAIAWQAVAARDGDAWSAEFAVPRRLFADWSQVRVNVTHRRGAGKQARDLQLCPGYVLSADPDGLPDYKPSDKPDAFARLTLR
jgi:hypothetical protein